MIGMVFDDGARVIAALPDMLDLVGAASGTLGYRVTKRWIVLMDRGKGRKPRWRTAIVRPTERWPTGPRTRPTCYGDAHDFDHELGAYEDLLARASIAPSLN